MSNQSPKLLHIATLGKTVGIQGEMKLHVKSDFPEQFVVGRDFLINKKETLRFDSVNLDKGTVRIAGISNPEDAKRYTNVKLYATQEQTRQNCHLDEGEHFWFDLEDCDVYEADEHLGRVYELERFNATNYLVIDTEKSLIEKGYPKRFLVPFIEPFKQSVDINTKKIVLSGAKDILEAS